MQCVRVLKHNAFGRVILKHGNEFGEIFLLSWDADMLYFTNSFFLLIDRLGNIHEHPRV